MRTTAQHLQGQPLPHVSWNSPRGDRALDVYSRLLAERIVVVGDPLVPEVANVLMAQLLHLEAADPEKDIALYINAAGGDPTAAMAVLDTMTYVTCDVATFCFGQAADVAAVMLAAGTAGKRTALPHARVVLAQPRAQLQGQSVDVETGAAELLRIREQLAEVFADRTGHDPGEILTDTDRELVLTAAEARDYGIVDQVVEHRAV